MPTPQEKRVQDELDLLLTYQMEGMSDQDKADWKEYMTLIRKEYDDAAKKAEDTNLKEEERKYYADLKTSIASSLPDITRGAFNATAAFKNGDTLGGTAALMDICAAVIPVLTSLAAAGGPEGAIVGALFSVVGQILAFFAPKAPSLESKIKEMFEKMEADVNLVKAEAVETSIQRYASTIKDCCILLHKVLTMKIATVKDAAAFLEKTSTVHDRIMIGQDKLAVPEFASWEVAAWLSNSDKYDNEKWPEIMGHWCMAYANLVHCNVMLKCLANKKTMQEWEKDFEEKNPQGLLLNYPETRQDIWNALTGNDGLQGRIDAVLADWKDWATTALGVLGATEPNAKDRGLYVHRGTDGNGYPYLYAATGRSGFVQGWSPVKSGSYWLGNGYVDQFLIAVPQKPADPLKPQYRLFIPRSHNDRLYDAMIAPSPPAEVRRIEQEIKTGTFSAVCALSNAAAAQRGDEVEPCYVYATQNSSAGSDLLMFQLDGKDKATDSSWRFSVKLPVMSVSAVTHPPTTLPDDPDGDGLPPGSPLLGGTAHSQSIQYAGMHGSSEIFVTALGKSYYVPAPWPSYSGLAADDYYLWLFSPTAIACASHASIMKCASGKAKAARWMGYVPGTGGVLGDTKTQGVGNIWLLDGLQYTSEPPLKGFIFVWPCSDGTMTACSYQRSVEREAAGDHREFLATDTLGLFTTDYSVDVRSGSLGVGSWRKSSQAVASQVQKVAIPCWPMVQRLKRDLRIGDARKVMA